MLANAMFFEAFIAPSMAAQAPELVESYPAGNGWEGFLAGTLAAGARFGVRFLLFGFALLRAESVPRWTIVLAIRDGRPRRLNVDVSEDAATHRRWLILRGEFLAVGGPSLAFVDGTNVDRFIRLGDDVAGDHI